MPASAEEAPCAAPLSLRVTPDATLPLLVANLVKSRGVQVRVELVDGSALPAAVLTSELNGVRVEGQVSVAQSLAATSADSSTLLGSDAATAAQIQQWVLGCSTPSLPLATPGLPRLRLLNSFLSSRPALVHPSAAVSLADIALLSAIHHDVACLPLYDRLDLCHLMRWVDLVQSTADVAGVLERVPVFPPPYQPLQVLADGPAN